MAREFKPTGKQLLKQRLKVQKAQSALNVQQSLLHSLAAKARGHEEIVEHDGRVYKVAVGNGAFPSVNFEHLGSVAEFNDLLKEAGH